MENIGKLCVGDVIFHWRHANLHVELLRMVVFLTGELQSLNIFYLMCANLLSFRIRALFSLADFIGTVGSGMALGMITLGDDGGMMSLVAID